MERNTFALADGSDWYAGNYEADVDFLLPHKPPRKRTKEMSTLTFVTDGIECAIQQAKTAAGASAIRRSSTLGSLMICLSTS
jgi:hypothetical protein